MIQKYGNIDVDDIRMKMDAVKQEPTERVQKYFERLDKLFQKGQISDIEQRRRFLARLRPEIRKLCVVRTFADIEELVGAATEVERVLAELGETPYEPLLEEQEEEASESSVERQVTTLNNTLINFFKGNAHNLASSSSSTVFGGCKICRAGDHMATTCPRLNEAWLKYAKCNMPHRTEGGEIKSTYNAGLGHSEDNCWKKPHFGVANFLEVLQNDEANLQQFNRLCRSEKISSYTGAPRRRMSVEVATGGAVPSPEVANRVTIHQGLGVDEKVNPTTVQDLPAYKASIDNDKETESMEAVVGQGVAPSPMKHHKTRTTGMAVSDAIFVGEAKKGAQSTDGVLGGAVEGMDEQLKEKLDNVEGLEVKCLTEEDLGILEEEKSPKLGLFLNTLASFEGPLSLADDVVDVSNVGEELVAYNMVLEGNLDMSEDDRIVIHVLPESNTEPAAMGVSSHSNNVMRGEHQADHGCLGLGSCGGTEVVQRQKENILRKQQLDRDEPADEERDEGNAFNAGDDGTEKETVRDDLDSGGHAAEEHGDLQDEEEDQDAEVAENKLKATDPDDRDLDQQRKDADLQQDVGMDVEVVKNEEERNNQEKSREESGESRHQQYFSLEPQMEVHFTDPE